MMTACDLGAVTKPWEISRKVGSLMYEMNVFLNRSWRAETIGYFINSWSTEK